MSYNAQYKQIMQPEKRIGRNNIVPRNVYRISTYTGSKPVTKVGQDSRWVFVIGRTIDKIHCIRLNEIKPLDFTNFINEIRDKRIPIGRDQLMSLLLKKFSKEGTELFESYIKPNKKLYPGGKSHYRIYKLDKITNIWEIRFEEGFLRNLFGEINTPQTEQQMDADIQEEIKEKDG